MALQSQEAAFQLRIPDLLERSGRNGLLPRRVVLKMVAVNKTLTFQVVQFLGHIMKLITIAVIAKRISHP